MAEEVTEGGGLKEGLREGTGELREELSRDRIEGRLHEAVNERPLARHLLDMGVVARALLIAAVITLIAWLLLGAKLAALLLVVSFGAAWFILGNRQYNRRKPTAPLETESTERS
jgi:Flp pilus assembly protein TadB